MIQLHFIAGLPRSGSTVLAALLRQNPAIHASISSPVASLYQRLLRGMAADSDYADALTDKRRGAIFGGLFSGYYLDIGRAVVFDTNRYWCSQVAALNSLVPQAKIVCCVRDPVLIIESFERLHQAHPLLTSKIYAPEDAVTLQTRVNALTADKGPIGFAYNALTEAFYGPFSEKLVLVDYSTLARKPGLTLLEIAAALDLPPHDYDPFNLSQIPEAEAFDLRMGAPGLHTIRTKMGLIPDRTRLPPEVVTRYSGRQFWVTHPAGSRAKLIMDTDKTALYDYTKQHTAETPIL